MTPATKKATETSLETKHLHIYDYPAIVSSCSHSTMLTEAGVRVGELNTGNERFTVVCSRFY